MAVSRALRRLLRIRNLEEEQGRVALEGSLGELRQLENVRAAAVEQDRRGRRLVGASAHSGELTDRLAGLEETRIACRLTAELASRIAEAEQNVADLREDFLAMRVERRQAETLVEEAQARDARDAERRAQQGLDDWFGNRLHGNASTAKPVALGANGFTGAGIEPKEDRRSGGEA